MGVFSPRVTDERRSATDWLHDDDGMMVGQSTSAGVRVDRDKAMRLSTVWACVRLLSNTIATLPTNLVVRIGERRFIEFDRPSWMSSPYPADPSMTWSEHIAQVATSLLLDGNYFVYVPGGIFDPSTLIVLDPRRVEIKAEGGTPYYIVRDKNWQIIAEVGPVAMLHGTWVRMPGELRGLAPIEAARQGIGTGLGAEDFAGRFFGQGTALSFGVEYPGKLTDEQKDQFREQMRKNYASSKNSHSVGILTDGAKFITGLGITNEQAQFIDSRKFTRDQIAGEIFGIPPHKIGSQEPGAASYNSVEQRNLDFRQDAVLPLADRIEGGYSRLVEVPDRLRGSGASAGFMFNLDVIARADLKSRAEAHKLLVEGGIATPNERRALEDLPPLAGGDALYMQQQYTPLDDPNRVPSPSAEPRAEPIVLNTHTHVNAETMRLDVPEIRMPELPSLPEMPAPIVNVHPPDVHVAAPIVNLPEPVVNVAPAEVRVDAPDMVPVADALDRLALLLRPRQRTVVRDSEGRIAGIKES